MAKLYFRHGTVASAKTLNLLAVAHNYKQQGKQALLLTPKFDNRFGSGIVKSRAGLFQQADYEIDDHTQFSKLNLSNVSCILVDEAQFLSSNCIEQLRALTISHDIPVICYGLRADFRTKLFEGSKRLFELADTIEEVKTTCAFCNKKAITNLKLINGKPSVDGPSIELGCEEKYLPACFKCYESELSKTAQEAGAIDKAIKKVANS